MTTLASVTIQKPYGTTFVISAQVGYISNLVSTNKNFVVVEEDPGHHPKLIGIYQARRLARHCWVLFDMSASEAKLVPDMYVSFEHSVQSALIDVCRHKKWHIISDITKPRKKRK